MNVCFENKYIFFDKEFLISDFIFTVEHDHGISTVRGKCFRSMKRDTFSDANSLKSSLRKTFFRSFTCGRLSLLSTFTMVEENFEFDCSETEMLQNDGISYSY